MSDPSLPPLQPLRPIGAPDPGTLPSAPTDSRPEDYETIGWGEDFLGNITTSWWFTVGEKQLDMSQPLDPEFDPLDSETIKGRENYAYYLKEARNRQHFDAIYDRIRNYEDMRQRLGEEGGWIPLLTGGLIDPLNIVPMAGLGGSFVRRVASNALAAGALNVAADVAQSTAVPVSAEDMAMDALVGGALGGALGGIAGRTARPISEIAHDINQSAKLMDEAVESGAMRNPMGDPGPGNVYEARPTDALAQGTAGRAEVVGQTGPLGKAVSAVSTGLQRGIEKTMTLPGLQSDYGRLALSGIRAFEELAQGMAGEMDMVLKRNVRGEATQQSAYLAAGRWSGRAGQMLNEWQNLYAKYVQGSATPLTIAGINVPVTAQRVKSAVTPEWLQKPGPKMSLTEFHREITRAHGLEKIEHSIPEVKQAAELMRAYYDEVKQAAQMAGDLPSPEGIRKKLDQHQAWASKRQRIVDSFSVRNDLSPQEQLLLVRAQEDLAFIKDRIEKLELLNAPRGAGASYAPAAPFRPETPTTGAAAAANLNIPPNVVDIATGRKVKVKVGPTGKKRVDGSPVMALYREKTGELLLDVEAIRASWAEKPWRTPKMDGVKALDDALFPTPDDWVEFVTRHELIHTKVKQAADQLDDDYENVVNDLAVGELRERQAAPRPAAMGAGPAPPGDVAGGVRRLVAANDDQPRWNGPADDPMYFNRIWDKQKVLDDEAGPKNLRGILKQWFLANPNPKHDPNALKADYLAGKIDQILASLDDKKALIAHLEDLYWTRGLTPKQENFLLKLKDRVDKGLTAPQKKYIRQLAKRFNDEQAKLDQAKLDPLDRAWNENIDDRVDAAIQNILGLASDGEYQGGGDSIFGHRGLNIPNQLVIDFIEDDASVVARNYAHRTGQGLEFTKMFGSRDAELAIRDAALQAVREGHGKAKVDEHMAQARMVRDLTLGDVWKDLPTNLNAETAKLIREGVHFGQAYATITSLGGTVLTSLTEVARPIAVHGLQRNLDFALRAMTDTAAFKDIGAAVRRETGQGLETAMGLTMNKFGDHGGPMGGYQSMAKRWVSDKMAPVTKFAGGPYWLVNLLGPFTDIMKNYGGVMTAHYLIEDAKAIARGNAPARVKANWTALGLHLDDAARILDEPIEKDKALNVANAGDWLDGDLSQRFYSAVHAQTRRISPGAGVAHLPNLAKGLIRKGQTRREIALLRIPYQFTNYAFAATTKVVLSGLQGRDQNALAGALTMFGIGYAMVWANTPSSIWDEMSMTDRLERAFDKSGLGVIFTTLNSRIEQASGSDLGIRPALNLPPRYGFMKNDPYARAGALGPVVGKGVTFGQQGINMGEAMFGGTPLTKEDKRASRRLVPMSDIFYMRWLFDEMDRTTAQ